MKIKKHPSAKDITPELHNEITAYARGLARQKRDLGFDDHTASEWVNDVILICLDPQRTTVRKNLKATLMFKIRGKASDATDKALRYRDRMKRYQDQLETNEHFHRSTFETCSPADFAEILDVVNERIDRWDDLN